MKPGIRFGYMYAEFMLDQARELYQSILGKDDKEFLTKEEQEREERVGDAWERSYDLLTEAEMAEEGRIRHQTWTDECNETSLRLN